MSGSLLDCPMVNGSYFQLILGSPAAWKLGASEYGEALFRRFGASRPDFFDFLGHWEGVQKLWFFGIAPKHLKSKDKSNLGAPCRHFGLKNMTFYVPFGIVFLSFWGMTKNQEKCLFYFIFQWFWTMKNHWFSNWIFIVFSTPLPGTVFRGARCRDFIKSWMLVPFSIFKI